VYVWLAVISFGIIDALNGLGKTPPPTGYW